MRKYKFIVRDGVECVEKHPSLKKIKSFKKILSPTIDDKLDCIIAYLDLIVDLEKEDADNGV